MKLSVFILANLEHILQDWEDFASTLEPLANANKKELRDHAAAILKIIAADLDTPQSDHQSIAKSHGLAPQATGDTAAEIHAAYTVQNEGDVIPPSRLRTFFDPVKRISLYTSPTC